MIRPLFIVVLILSAAAWPATSQQYTWDQVLIGGGGAIPTTVAHPTAKDVVFTTHDVCGPYRYNAARGRFEYLCGQFGWETMESRQYHGTECLVVDPTDATGNTIYATLGEWAFRPEGHGFFKSLDRGTTWTKANYPGIMTATDQFGAVQHICVDPANPQVIYHANRKGGLYRSTDGGASFTKTTAPEGDLTNWDEQKGSSGVRIVAVNPGTGTVTGPVRSKIVWINVATGPWETALWESTDGGESFHAMNAPCVNAMRIVCRDDGSALIASSNGLW